METSAGLRRQRQGALELGQPGQQLGEQADCDKDL